MGGFVGNWEFFFGTAAAINMHQALVHEAHQKLNIKIS
jgi:hypothetical protein